MNDNDTDVLQMNVSDFPRLSLSLHYELADHPNSSVDNYRKHILFQSLVHGAKVRYT